MWEWGRPGRCPRATLLPCSDASSQTAFLYARCDALGVHLKRLHRASMCAKNM